MEPTNNATARSYLDFQGLGQLRGQAARDGKGALRETAQQFEALFLQMMMKSMRDTVEKSELTQSPHSETFEAMFDREVSLAMAKRNVVGLADMLVEAQTRQMSAIKPAAEALAEREASAPKPMALQPAQAPVPLKAPPAVLSPLELPGKPMALPRLDTTLSKGTP